MRVRRIGVTGSPATGKKTISSRLAEALGVPYIDLNEAAESSGSVLGRDPLDGDLVVDVGSLSRAISSLLPEGGFVVSGVYLAEVVPARLLDRVVVLRCDPRVLKSRYESRGYREPKVRENLTAEFLDYCLLKALRRYGERVREVDVTGKGEDEALALVLEALRAPRAKVGRVDWLSTIKDPEEARRFLV